MTTTLKSTDVQVFRVYIKATPQAIWDHITNPEWNQKYGYTSRAEYELCAGGAYRAFANDAMKAHGAEDVIIDGEILECDPPRKLVQTWRPLWDPEVKAEGAKRLTWEIEAGRGGVTTLTITHELDGAPRTADLVTGKSANAGGGWSFVLSDLKTLLETGKAFAG